MNQISYKIIHNTFGIIAFVHTGKVDSFSVWCTYCSQWITTDDITPNKLEKILEGYRKNTDVKVEQYVAG